MDQQFSLHHTSLCYNFHCLCRFPAKKKIVIIKFLMDCLYTVLQIVLNIIFYPNKHMYKKNISIENWLFVIVLLCPNVHFTVSQRFCKLLFYANINEIDWIYIYTHLQYLVNTLFKSLFASSPVFFALFFLF